MGGSNSHPMNAIDFPLVSHAVMGKAAFLLRKESSACNRFFTGNQHECNMMAIETSFRMDITALSTLSRVTQ